MKRIFFILIVIFVTFPIQAQWKIKGTLFTSVYSWEGEASKSTDLYPGLQFVLSNPKIHYFSLHGFGRTIFHQSDSRWDERIYNLYAKAKLFSRGQITIGRQFVYDGVVNGTLDGFGFKFKGENNFHFNVYAGMNAPLYKEAKILNWNNDRTVGFSVGGNFLPGQYVQFSSMKKWISSKKALHMDGLIVNGRLNSSWFYYINAQYNDAKKKIQRNIIRLTYSKVKWYMDVEYIHQLPMIYEFSYFNIFESEAFNQIRFNVTRKLSKYSVTLGYNYTLSEENNTSEFNLVLSRKKNSLGLLYNTGFAGDNLGLYGQVYQRILTNLYLRLYGNYYTYQRYQVDISEEAISYSGGLDYRTGNFLTRLELQQMSNNLYKSDVRLLLHIFYRFAL